MQQLKHYCFKLSRGDIQKLVAEVCQDEGVAEKTIDKVCEHLFSQDPLIRGERREDPHMWVTLEIDTFMRS